MNDDSEDINYMLLSEDEVSLGDENLSGQRIPSSRSISSTGLATAKSLKKK